MTTPSLRTRLAEGDLSALTDPALELQLVAEPNADWWRDGVQACLREVYARLVQALVDARLEVPVPEADQPTDRYLVALLNAVGAGSMPTETAALRVLLLHGAAHVEGAVDAIEDARNAEVIRQVLETQGFPATVRVRRFSDAVRFVATLAGAEMGLDVSHEMLTQYIGGPRELVRSLAARFVRGFAQAEANAVRLGESIPG